MFASATVLFDHKDQSTFRGIRVNYLLNKKEKCKYFRSEDPIIDFYDLMCWLLDQEKQFWLENILIDWGHSKDEFLKCGNKDGDKYIERYFNPATGKFHTINTINTTEWERIDRLLKCVITKKFKIFFEVRQYHKKFKQKQRYKKKYGTEYRKKLIERKNKS